MSSGTQQTLSFPSPPPSPPPVDSPPRPRRQPLRFQESISDWFTRNSYAPSDPIYIHLPIMPPALTPSLVHNLTSHIMATMPLPAIPLPQCQSPNMLRFDPKDHSTLETYLSDYELAADAAHLTPAERLSQCTRYLGKQEKEDWEGLPEFKAIPPDWDTFKEALFQDYPNARKLVTSAALNSFIEERSQQPNHSLDKFATYNWDFRRITGRLAREGRANPDELRKAYTKSIHRTLCQ